MKKVYCIITHKNTKILREIIQNSKDDIYIYIYISMGKLI